MTVIWNFPTRILFGEGCVTETGPEAKTLGASRALIVSDPGVVAAGLTTRVDNALADMGIQSTLFDGLASNPTDKHVEAATEAYKSSGADLVVGVGGGSAIDVAKLVRLLATHPGPLAQYDDARGGSALVTGAVAPMIAVPTTAGTGSEVGRSGVCTMGETQVKTVFFSPHLVPDVAVLDPMLTLSMPPKITAATGFDALTHCIEALCTNMDHPMAEAIAAEGIRLCVRNLETAVADGNDVEARGGMLKAAAMGAVAFQKGLGACHSLAHPLSSETGMHHGLANAQCLPAVVDFNRSAAPAKLAQVARLLGVRADDEETLAFECSGAIRALRKRCGLPDGLGSLGLSEERLDVLADLAFADPCHQDNPRKCAREDLLALYRASM